MLTAFDRTPDQRLLVGAPATLTATLYGSDGDVDDSLDSGVTVTVTRLDGTALVTGQSATCTDGVATYALTAAQTGAGLDLLTAQWTHNSVVRSTTVHEVVGRHWFAPRRLLDEPGVNKAVAALPGDVGVSALIAARTWAESLIEHATGVAWVPRTFLDSLDACGVDEVLLTQMYPRTLRTLTIDGTAETVADWTVTKHGGLRRDTGGSIWTSNALGLVARYDYGLDAPPAPLLDAAIEAAADYILSRTSRLGRRATGFDGQFGTISYATVDKDRPTGIPHVDAVIRAHDRRIPGMA